MSFERLCEEVDKGFASMSPAQAFRALTLEAQSVRHYANLIRIRTLDIDTRLSILTYVMNQRITRCYRLCWCTLGLLALDVAYRVLA